MNLISSAERRQAGGEFKWKSKRLFFPSRRSTERIRSSSVPLSLLPTALNSEEQAPWSGSPFPARQMERANGTHCITRCKSAIAHYFRIKGYHWGRGAELTFCATTWWWFNQLLSFHFSSPRLSLTQVLLNEPLTRRWWEKGKKLASLLSLSPSFFLFPSQE